MDLEVKGLRIKVHKGDSGEYLEITVDGPITIKAPVINFEGNLEVKGNIHATGTIIDDSGNTNHHSH